MGSFYNSCSSTNFKGRNHFSTEHRPKLLKDFLIDDDSNPCSSSGFRSFPGKPFDSTMKTLIEIDLSNPKSIANSSNNIASYKLLRSHSKAAASTTISAFQAMITAVKNIHFTAVKSPSILPRSLSRKLSKKKSQNKENEVKITVTIKDIIRWRSFRDAVEDKYLPPDSPSSPHHCTTTTTTGSTSTTPRSGSSWCDSDFTSDYLPSWNGNFDECGENEKEVGKKISPGVGEDSSVATTEAITNTKVGPEEDEEEQLHSPVSETEFESEEDEDSSSSFEQSLATVERTREKIMEKIRRFESLAKLDPVNLDNWMSIDENISSREDDDDGDDLEGIRETNMNFEEEIHEVEEKAWKLLSHVKETGLECCSNNMNLLFDFFRDELGASTCESTEQRIDVGLLNKAKAWMNGEDSLWAEWELEHMDREVCVRDMDREGRWGKSEDEQNELASEIESEVLHLLVDELLLDLISH
ncbi:hypothetical protein OIU84_016023 [Salix udensis]|uniref:DUF4378 domain-containing protein n=1 Tax=Salix udensis TaxID=889485 RepID=A0AAD6J8R7_9ROSI|nr:hypothetical protein OIU84_016023 [Salix udensis]